MINEVTPVTFCNKEGFRLFGMFHQPASPVKSGVAIILLSPGVKMRVAPHRLYIKLTERFLSLGYPVLRFDFYGLGDSEGEVREEYLADLYGSIQVGRYVDDTIAAMDWMQLTYGMSQFIVSGLCGGAITGLLAGARDSRITCLLGLAIPVILDGAGIDSMKYMTDTQSKGMRDSYIQKLWTIGAWRSWVRFFTFKSEYRLIARLVFKPFLPQRGPATSAPPLPCQSQGMGDNTNPHFAPAFRRMVSTSRYVYLIFAGMDRLYYEFEKKFVERNRVELGSYSSWYEVHVTKDANHIFSFRDWEEDMLDQCSTWLGRLNGSRREAVTRPKFESLDEISRTTA